MPIDTYDDLPRVIAHEAGHAVVAWASRSVPPPVAVRFYPLEGEASVQLASWPMSGLPGVYLEFTSVYLGGFAGETVALGGFQSLLKADFQSALEVTRLVRRIGKLPRRRGAMTPFRARLPWRMHGGMKRFLNDAFDLAVSRIETHRGAFEHLRGKLSRGYCVDGKVEFLADELDAWLGPRPFAVENP